MKPPPPIVPAAIVAALMLSTACSEEEPAAASSVHAPPRTMPAHHDPLPIESSPGKAFVEFRDDFSNALQAWDDTLDQAHQAHPLIDAFFSVMATYDFTVNFANVSKHSLLQLVVRGLDNHATPWATAIADVAVPVCRAAADQRRAKADAARAEQTARKRFESIKDEIERDAASRRRAACRRHFANFYRDLRVTVRCDGSRSDPTFRYDRRNSSVVGIDRTINFALGKYRDTVSGIEDDTSARLRQARQDADANLASLRSRASASERGAGDALRALGSNIAEVKERHRRNVDVEIKAARAEWRDPQRIYRSRRPDAELFRKFLDEGLVPLVTGDYSYPKSDVKSAAREWWNAAADKRPPIKKGLVDTVNGRLDDAMRDLRHADGNAACKALRTAENTIKTRIRHTKNLLAEFRRLLEKEATGDALPFPSPILCCSLGQPCCRDPFPPAAVANTQRHQRNRPGEDASQ